MASDQHALTIGLAIALGLVFVALLIAVVVARWLSGSRDRARQAATIALTPLSNELRSPLGPMGQNALPGMMLTGPTGSVAIFAELVPDGTPLNAEPNAWLRYLVMVPFYLACCVVLALIASGSDSSRNDTPDLPSGPLRCLCIAVPLPAWFANLTLSSRGLLSRIFAGRYTGDPLFDGRFNVTAPNPNAALAALTPPVRQALLALVERHGKVHVRHGQLLWRRRSYDIRGLRAVLDSMLQTAAVMAGISR